MIGNDLIRCHRIEPVKCRCYFCDLVLCWVVDQTIGVLFQWFFAGGTWTWVRDPQGYDRW